MEKNRPPFKVSDYLQISCLGKYSVEINVEGKNDYRGNILVKNGELWSAADSIGKGEDAFRRVVLEKSTIVDCSTFSGKAPGKNIETDWEELIFKIYTKKDREIFLSKKTEETNTRVNEIYKKKMLSEATEYLLEKNYKKALEVLLELKKTDPCNKKALAKLKKLKELGYEK